MAKSTHLAEVIRIKELLTHPNADKLKIVNVYGYTVCVRIGDFKEGDLGIYIPPDNVVSDRPEFAFLENHKRIKVKKLRGIISMGLLIQVPADLADLKEGDDAAEKLGITHYEPPLPMSTGGEAEKPPEGYFPHYDVDSYYRYVTLFKPGELVVGTEKIHGCLFKDSMIRIRGGSEKPIKDIATGDVVLSYNRKANQFEERVVKHLIVRPQVKSCKWLKIHLQNGKNLILTTNHKVFTKRGWVLSENLKMDDDLLGIDD